MGEEDRFDPHKARRATPDRNRVENVPFTEMQTKADIINRLNDLDELLKAASAEDYDEVFRGYGVATLQRYKDRADQMSMNLRRMIESRNSENNEKARE